MRKVCYRKMTSHLTEIKLTKTGFSVNVPFGAKPKMYNWDEIDNLRFSENYNEVFFKICSKQLVLKNNNTGFYEFIQNIPSTFKNFDFKYVSEFLNS